MFKKQHVFSSKTENFKDLGFGTRSSDTANRRLNKNGSFNVVRVGTPFFKSFEIYHKLISMSWLRFTLLVLSFYVVINLLFAFLYILVGVENLTGVNMGSFKDKFFEAFFFSSQTITTVGYGRIAPVSITASALAAIESMIGLLGFALATGLLYGRFSRPDAKITYSKSAVIAPYKDMNAFMFRLLNSRDNQLIETEVELVVSMLNPDKKSRIFDVLNLERTKVSFLPLSWTVVHPIDENSPLYGYTKEELKKADAEFIILLKTFDDTFSQTIYSRTSYIVDEIEWGAKFKNIITFAADGKTILDVSRNDEFEHVKLNELKAVEA